MGESAPSQVDRGRRGPPWRPTANLPGSTAYTDRREAADRLCSFIDRVRIPSGAPDELRYLIKAMRRVAGCSFANRRGEAYYVRKREVFELRGCLVVWKRSIGAIP